MIYIERKINMQTNFISLIQQTTHWPAEQIKIASYQEKRDHIYSKIIYHHNNYLATGSPVSGNLTKVNIKPLSSPFDEKMDYRQIVS